MRANFDGDHDGDLFWVEICPHRPDIYDFRSVQAASWSWRRWLNGCLAHAPARHGVDVSHSAPIAVQERRIDIEREGIIFETIHSEMK